MEKVLLFIKHNIKFLWELIDWANGFLFGILHQARMQRILSEVLAEYMHPVFSFRRLESEDMECLSVFIHSQPSSDLEYFRPHNFDLKSLNRQASKKSFLMMGAFDNQKLIGYFFLRFFINRKCFVGRLTGAGYRGLGVGKIMNNIMYETAWRMNFRCLSTISKKNQNVMRAHLKNRSMIVIKDLSDGYMLVEFVREPVISVRLTH